MEYFPYYSTAISPDDYYYWTISEYYDDPTKVWKLLISFGLIEEESKTGDPPQLHKVRCVHGDTEPAASYTDNGDGTVKDDVTGLMWEQKTDDGGSRDKDNIYTWKDALVYCENLLLADYSDWRLPNAKEIERLVDLGRSSPAIDTIYFPNTNNGLYWTGTTCSGCHKMKAFAIDFTDGELYYGNKYRHSEYGTNYVRAVRDSDPDNDGAIDPNDNCYAIPNGIDLGTCAKTIGDIEKGTGVTCYTADDCGSGESCQRNQEDCNGNLLGDACECYADFNGDGYVYPSDLSVFLSEYGRTDCLANPPCQADIDGDGNVYPSDLSIFLEEYGKDDCPTVP